MAGRSKCVKKLKNVTAHCVNEELIYCAPSEVSSMQTWMRVDRHTLDIAGTIREGYIILIFIYDSDLMVIDRT
jgi:hypothetical protein